MRQGVIYYGVESSVMMMMMMMMIKNLHRMQSVFGNLENAETFFPKLQIFAEFRKVPVKQYNTVWK